MAANIEDAGFEIRDQIMWIYGSGFPKSHNISKQIDKTYICEYKKIAKTAVKSLRLLQVKLNEDTDGSVPENVVILQEENQENKMVIGVVEDLSQTDISIYATMENIEANTTLLLKNILEEGLNQEKKFITLTELKTITDLKIWNLLQKQNTRGNTPIHESVMNMGTSLKPANEPICMARKPLSEKTVAENVLKWGTGGINIEGCRVGTELISHGTSKADIRGGSLDGSISGSRPRLQVEEHITEGRFPANIILDEIAGELLDEQSGIVNQGHWPKGSVKGFGEFGGGSSSYEGVGQKDKTKSGASRFFYQAKVSKAERNMGLDGFEEQDITDGSTRTNEETARAFGANRKNKTNNHPTVKPVSLMAYLCRLVTPAGGIVLDPFMGSGSTGIAARLEGFRFCGMEMDGDYFKIAEARIENYEQYRKFIK
jgi:hypothetical protein